MRSERPVLVAGIPRSGSTWVAEALSRTPGYSYCHEPDNEKSNSIAYALKRKLHRYPYLRGDDEHGDYHDLWKIIFSGQILPPLMDISTGECLMPDKHCLEQEIGQKCGIFQGPAISSPERNPEKGAAPDSIAKFAAKFTKPGLVSKLIANGYTSEKPANNLVVKSVHATLSLPWIVERFNPRVVVIIRNPLNVISSYLDLKLSDATRNIFVQKGLMEDHLLEYADLCQSKDCTARVQQMALQIGGIYKVIENHMSHNPEWIVVRHEDLCENPLKQFERLYERLNLEWTGNTANYIHASNREGRGFQTKRVSALEIDKWKRKLSPNQASEIRECLAAFKLSLYP